MSVTYEQMGQIRQAKIDAVCREWEQIAGAPGRYRITVADDRVTIAQFHAPEDCPSVEFGPAKGIKYDPIDMERLARQRGVHQDQLHAEIWDYCQSLRDQWGDLTILDTSE